MKLTIYKKMMIGYWIIIVGMILVNAYVLNELHTVSITARATLASDVQAIDLAKQLQSILYEEERHGQKFRISHDHTYYALFTDDARRFTQYADSLFDADPSPQERIIIADIQRAHAWTTAMMNQEQQAMSNPPPAVRIDLARTWADSLDDLHGKLSETIRLNQLSIGNSMNRLEATTNRSINVSLTLVVCTVFLAIIAAFLITRTITRPIRTLIRGTQQIAHGNFTPIRVTSHDEIALLAEAVNDMSRQLSRINELKEEMMQHIAHELRTPLATMLTAHYLLAEHKVGPVTPEQVRLLGSIRNGIDKLTTFSHDFLDLSKIEAGMMEYSFEPTDLTAFMKPIIEDAMLTASQKEISVDLTTSPVPEVMVDRQKFGQVVTNLLSNAIKYTEKEGSIVVNVSPCESGVRIAVQDTGVGIAPEDIPKVFTRFYRVKTASRTGSKGTGVGLALAKAVTEAHGGKIYATSAVGVGSTFTVELPVAPATIRAAEVPTMVNQEVTAS